MCVCMGVLPSVFRGGMSRGVCVILDGFLNCVFVNLSKLAQSCCCIDRRLFSRFVGPKG